MIFNKNIILKNKRIFLKKMISNFDIFFNKIDNNLYLNNKYLWLKISLPNFLFIQNNYYFKNNSKKLFIKLFLINNFFEFWKLFWNFISLNKRVNLGCFVELTLIGLGFKIKKITNSLYRFFWGYSTYIYMFVPNSILVQYSFEFKKIIFFGININLVNNLVSFLILLKKMLKYRLLGFIKFNKIIRLRINKKH